MAPRSCHTTPARPSLVLLPSLHLPHLLPWGKGLEHNKLLTYNLLGFFVSEKTMAVRASSLSELCYSTYLISYRNRTLHTIFAIWSQTPGAKFWSFLSDSPLLQLWPSAYTKLIHMASLLCIWMGRSLTICACADIQHTLLPLVTLKQLGKCILQQWWCHCPLHLLNLCPFHLMTISQCPLLR